MESRKITVKVSSNQRVYTINTNATTLGELKEELISRGAPIANTTFTEGYSRTTLVDDQSLLPTNVINRKTGETTNDLMFLLTTTEKKIKSGVMSRKEMVEFIKSRHLEARLKAETGKNYTNCSNDTLAAFVSKYSEIIAKGPDYTPTKSNSSDSNLEDRVAALEKKVASLEYMITNTETTNGKDAPTPEEDEFDDSYFDFI